MLYISTPLNELHSPLSGVEMCEKHKLIQFVKPQQFLEKYGLNITHHLLDDNILATDW